MYVYRIVHTLPRTTDLSGAGAYRTGGRWNSKGVYMLYTSANSSLAMLEMLVHLDTSVLPAHLYLMQLKIDDGAPIFVVPDSDYPSDWKEPGSISTKHVGDQWIQDHRYFAVQVRSAVNELEFNLLLDPLFPEYGNLVSVNSVREMGLDGRLL